MAALDNSVPAAALASTARVVLPPAAPLAHHNQNGRGFINPWASYEDRGPLSFFTTALREWDRSTEFHPQPIRRIPWAALQAADPLAALWVGHVTFLLRLRGWSIITDPLFSHRPSPVQWAGPARFTPPACRVSDLPPLDVVLISHNHYDHLDESSIRDLLRKAKADAAADANYRGLTFVCPLGVDALLVSFGVPRASIRCLDWWEDAVVEDRSHAQREPLRVTAVPAQHQSARTPFDRNVTLWAGFVVTAGGGWQGGRSEGASLAGVAGTDCGTSTVYFSGDTGYRTVGPGVAPYSDAEAAAPHCPAFSEIGRRCPPIDLALLPIGAYSPRSFMSAFHGALVGGHVGKAVHLGGEENAY